MLSRAFVKPRRGPQTGETSLRSSSIFEYEDFLFGFMDTVPLTLFGDEDPCYLESESRGVTLRQILRASVGVMGESCLGMTEKVVLLGGKICAVKRFRRVVIRKNEFGRRIERVAEIGRRCEFLVPLNAYLYAKRIKFVVSEYYPMGSLADLLAGTKEQGHTALEWEHKYKIIKCIAKAIQFIHSQKPPREKQLKLNVHGNIKTSNVMINIDFTARLSDYGFIQLAEPVAVEDTGQADVAPSGPAYEEKLCQESDIYNFGVVLMDLLGWPDGNLVGNGGELEKQVLNLYNVALSCRNSLVDARPTIDDIMASLGDSLK